MDIIYWFTSALALIGVWLNIKKNVACFWIWAFTNATWAYADAMHDLLPQAALQAIYCLLSVYGIVKWSTEAKKEATSKGDG
jgi:nicotinamide mononucleotide transporter